MGHLFAKGTPMMVGGSLFSPDNLRVQAPDG